MGRSAPPNQPTLAAFLAPSSGAPSSGPPPPARPGAQRTLDSLAKVVKIPRGVAAEDHLRAALPLLAAAEADPVAALAALRRLACVDVTRRDLVVTQAGVAVRRLKACSHYDVSMAAARLVDKWKGCVMDEIDKERKKEGKAGS